MEQLFSVKENEEFAGIKSYNKNSEQDIRYSMIIAESETTTPVSDDQKKFEIYDKGVLDFRGLKIFIENPAGSIRSGIDSNGTRWTCKIVDTYGCVKGLEGKDGDLVDVFIGDSLLSNLVFIIDQLTERKEFDEHKCMLGFDTVLEAIEAYRRNYSSGWDRLGYITVVSFDYFKKWLYSDHSIPAHELGFESYKVDA